MDKSATYVMVVGIDDSPNSIHALGESLEMASARKAELHVVHVEHNPLLSSFESEGVSKKASDAGLERVRTRVSEKIAEITGRLGPLPLRRVIAHYRRGSPAEQITQLAADVDADMVVVGSHGHRPFERFMLGSVAERTNRLARCPVWTVRPKDYGDSGRVPVIEPPCPDCVAKRQETNGKELWCARHSEHHIRPHVLAYTTDPFYNASTLPYESTPM